MINLNVSSVFGSRPLPSVVPGLAEFVALVPASRRNSVNGDPRSASRTPPFVPDCRLVAMTLAFFLPHLAPGFAAEPNKDKPVVTNPFSTTGGNDTGYAAQSRLSGTRLNTNLTEKWRGFWEQNPRVLLEQSSRLAPVAENNNGIIETVGEALTSTQQQIRANGQRPRGLIPLRFAARTGYSFTEGMLKGVSLGAGFRHQAVQVTDFEPATATPVPVRYGRANALVDVNVGYSVPSHWLGAIGGRFRYALQLNVNNALDRTAILPLRMSPAGRMVNYRFQAPREYIVTNRLSF